MSSILGEYLFYKFKISITTPQPPSCATSPWTPQTSNHTISTSTVTWKSVWYMIQMGRNTQLVMLLLSHPPSPPPILPPALHRPRPLRLSEPSLEGMSAKIYLVREHLELRRRSDICTTRPVRATPSGPYGVD
jgi:hypothetical protein